METLTKNIFFRLFIIFLIAFSFLLLSDQNVDAKFIKKLTVEAFTSPIGWDKGFKPGIFYSSMLEKKLRKSGVFQMVTINKKEPSIKITDDQAQTNIEEKKNEMNTPVDILSITSIEKTPLSQYKIQGNVLRFEPDTHPLKKDHTNKQAKVHKEQAVIQVNIELLNLHTGRLLAKKIFTVKSNKGRKPFDLDSLNTSYELDDLKVHSAGKALSKLNNEVVIFINKTLNKVPLEGDLIFVDHNNNFAIINLGKANGVNLRDVFTVFSVEPKFNDPVDKIDLGDMYTRKGIIKISEVQGRFSKAQIIAGENFIPGDLVVPKIRKSEKSIPNDQSQQYDINWGDYKGLPSLSY
jgi:hypothetical protein